MILRGLFIGVCMVSLLACYKTEVPQETKKPVPPPPPKAEIEKLLHEFERSGVSFERNGVVMDNAAARVWLQQKWERHAAVATPEDFIENVARISLETKLPYIIIEKDGKKVASAVWFTERLRKIRQSR